MVSLIADPERYKPDYTTPAADLFIDINTNLLREDPALNFLSYVDGNPPGFPGWAPNWSSLDLSRNTFCEQKSNFAATGDTKSTRRLSDDRSSLTLSGIILDTVADTGHVFDPAKIIAISDQDERNEIYWTQSARCVAEGERIAKQIDPSSYDGSEGFEEAFWRTWICNTSLDGQLPPKAFGTCFKEFVAGSRGPPAREFDRTWARWRNARVFAMTENGSMGMIPAASARGDIVCTLMGARWPFVIRINEDENSHRLIGECYFHGMMDGEILRSPNLESKLQDIILS